MFFLVDNGQLHQNYVFMFSHNFDGIVSCNVMYAYTRIHCARKRGLKGHLPRVNLIELHKWPVGLLLLRKIGFMPQNLSKTMAEICVEMTETSGTMAEISGNFLPSLVCN